MAIKAEKLEQANEIMGVVISKVAKSLAGFYDPDKRPFGSDEAAKAYIESLQLLEYTNLKGKGDMKIVFSSKTDKEPASLSQVWFDSEKKIKINLMKLILDEENPVIETVGIAIDETQVVVNYRIDSDGKVQKTYSLSFGADEYTQSARKALISQNIIVEEILEWTEKVDFAQIWEKFIDQVASLDTSVPELVY